VSSSYLGGRELVVPAELGDGAEPVEGLGVGVDIGEVGTIPGGAVQPGGSPQQLVLVAAEGVVEVLDLENGNAMSGVWKCDFEVLDLFSTLWVRTDREFSELCSTD
jgi:hypothetical protein